MSDHRPVDQDIRDKIESRLDKTFIVNAGAGTGKTTAFVSRIMSLITTGTTTIDQVAAITFTRAAAGVLRERIGIGLEAVIGDETATPEKVALASAALEGLDHASISTIHSFAESLVRERAVDDGLPLIIEPLDDVESALEFDDQWSEWVDKALDDERGDAIVRLASLGMSDPVSRIREIATRFHENYDRIRDVEFQLETQMKYTAAQSLIRETQELEGLLEYSKLDDEDELYSFVSNLITFARSLELSGADQEVALEELIQFGKLSFGKGRQGDWEDNPEGVNAAKLLKALLKELEDERILEIEQARSEALVPVLQMVRKFVLNYAADRRNSGRAEFQDLLVWAYDLLRNSSDACDYFTKRYSHILIDEFQDTDPLQLEIALLLSGCGENQDSVRDGALFVVGDPKQSIYRFRRADPTVIYRLPERSGAKELNLLETFRAHQGIVNWVNAVFTGWMGTERTPSQPDYVELVTPHVADEATPSQGVYYIGGEEDESNIGPIRETEVEHIAQLARSVGMGKWEVSAGRGQSGTRPSKYSDLAILFPRRTSLDQLTRALEKVGVPYSLEDQSLIYNSQEVRDIVTTLAAIDDPTDQIAAVAALRSPLFGCSDPELLEWRNSGRNFSHSDLADPASGAVGEGLSYIAARSAERHRVSVPEIIEKIVSDRKLKHLAQGSAMHVERLRQIGVLLQGARAVSATSRSSLRDFVAWAQQRAERRDRFPEGGEADIGRDAVRLMTTYSAKGLEFPLVLLTALNGGSGGSSESVRLYFDKLRKDHVAIRVGSNTDNFVFGPYDDLHDIEKSADGDEDVRLMYVAATRAEDYLIASMYRKLGDKSTLAAKLAQHAAGSESLWASVRDDQVESVEQVAAEAAFGSPSEYEAWKTDRERLLRSMSAPTTVSATSIKGSAEPDMPNDLKPESPALVDDARARGRGASAVGRAVHAVLQKVNLTTEDGVDELARSFADAEGISNRADEIANLARATLRVPVVQRAANASNMFREAYVGVPIQECKTGLEGFIDLAFQDDNGAIVIVDFKTDRVAEDTNLSEASAPYRTQLGAYAHAITQATGLRVSEAWLVFSRRARDGGEAEYCVEDLDGAAAEAVELAADVVGAAR